MPRRSSSGPSHSQAFPFPTPITFPFLMPITIPGRRPRRHGPLDRRPGRRPVAADGRGDSAGRLTATRPGLPAPTGRGRPRSGSTTATGIAGYRGPSAGRPGPVRIERRLPGAELPQSGHTGRRPVLLPQSVRHGPLRRVGRVAPGRGLRRRRGSRGRTSTRSAGRSRPARYTSADRRRTRRPLTRRGSPQPRLNPCCWQLRSPRPVWPRRGCRTEAGIGGSGRSPAPDSDQPGGAVRGPCGEHRLTRWWDG
jgi:hypothetical protein